MNVRQGNMLKHLDEIDLLCFTANSTLTDKHKLVMGAGSAKQVRDRFLGVDAVLGRTLWKLQYEGIQQYGLIVTPAQCMMHVGTFLIGAFQTKEDWKQLSTYDLLYYSVGRLDEYATKNSHLRIHLNFPGIGLGGLDKNMVYEFIKVLPNNVTAWYI